VRLRPPNEAGAAACDLFSLHVVAPAQGDAGAEATLRALWEKLSAGRAIRHPLGDDAFRRPAPSVAARLLRLREAAPFGELSWSALRMDETAGRAELHLDAPDGARVAFWLDERDGRPAGGYRLTAGSASPAVVYGLRALMASLSPGHGTAGRAGIESGLRSD
jgi:hypothetical protein